MIYYNNTYEINLKGFNEDEMNKKIEFLFKDNNINLEQLQITFLTDDSLLEINKEFLQHDYYTDIITFDYSETKEKIDGELFISVERVEENAVEFKESFENEIQRVILHGCLHLCGLNDQSEAEKNEMRNKENYYLNK
jgi:probable rRNA maturation factor